MTISTARSMSSPTRCASIDGHSRTASTPISAVGRSDRCSAPTHDRRRVGRQPDVLIVGLVPAAGFGRRLAGAVQGSKEVQPVRGQPVMSYLLERLRIGGADRIVVTTRPEKVDVIALATRVGIAVVTGRPVTSRGSLLLAAADLADETIALFGFPDSVWTPADGFRPLRRRVEDGESIALGLFETDHPERSDVVVVDADDRLVGIDSKPAHPTSAWIWAAGAARVGALRAILARAGPDEEIGTALARHAASAPIATVRLGRVLDVGQPDTLRDAAMDPVFMHLR